MISPKNKILPALLSGFLLVWTLAFFWKFAASDINDFDRDLILQSQFESSEQLIQQLHQAFVGLTDKSFLKTLVVIQGSDCQCNRFQESHLQQLVDSYPQHKVARLDYKQLDRQQKSFIPNLTAVVILNNREVVEYFGPLNSGLECTSESSFVETIMTQAPREHGETLLNLMGRSCFCRP